MCPKAIRFLAPKATEPILLWLKDKPTAIHMSDALTSYVGTDGGIWKARLHDDRADVEWRAGVLTDTGCQLCAVHSRIDSIIDVNV